jgi:hypothetical protein
MGTLRPLDSKYAVDTTLVKKATEPVDCDSIAENASRKPSPLI